MDEALEAGIYTDELTNDSLTIVKSMGVRQISVYNRSAVSGTVTGSQKLLGSSSSAITLEQGETITVNGVSAAEVIKNLIITAPASCTLTIVAAV